MKTEKIAVLRARLGRVDRVPLAGPSAASDNADKAAIVRRCAAGPEPFPPCCPAMANIHSQKKRILRAERERLENRRYTSAVKTYFRRLEAAVAGDEGDAVAEHRRLVSTIDKAVKSGALHRNTGARKKSRAARLLAGGGESA